MGDPSLIFKNSYFDIFIKKIFAVFYIEKI